MKIAVVADTHFANFSYPSGDMKDGVTQRLRHSVDVFKAALNTPGIDGLVIAGDVFDTWRPPPYVVAYVMSAIHRPTAAGKPVHVWGMLGNHDTHTDIPYDHSLGALEYTEYFSPVDLCRRVGDMWLIPFGYSIKDMSPPAGVRVVVAHHGIYDDSYPAFLRDSKGALHYKEVLEWCDKHNVRYYLSGDWHQHAVFGDGRIIQVGALCPTSYSNPGPTGYGTVVVVDMLPNEVSLNISFLPGPRFILAEMDSMLPGLDIGCIGYARVKRGGAVTPARYHHVEVVDHGVDLAAVARVSMESAKTLSVQEALHRWVDRDTKTPDDLRQDVFSQALAFLTAASGDE